MAEQRSGAGASGQGRGAGQAETDRELSAEELREIEERFDPESRFRPLSKPLTRAITVALFVLSVYHTYTAGFGIPRATNHMGLHLSFTLGLIFLSFAIWGRGETEPGLLRPLGLPVWDWALAILGIVSAYYVAWIYDDLAFRVGNPNATDLTMGTILILVLLEATRRAMGWPLPVIALLFMAYAYFGQSMPGVLQHPGASWSNIVNHLYLTSQGIYGTALIVISTYVFHFVLFGVLATRIGLGQLFIDMASAVAGRFSGGPAKVSVLSSAMLGSISGSSIANTVTTGALTIPAMRKIGYPKHFAAAVEAAASTGGQITPPVMGAVAFLMIEYLGVPLTTILTAALVPAFMHFFGVIVQVHLEAKRRGLRGLSRDEIPRVMAVLARDWLTVVPLILLVSILLSGRTPYNAAFWGILSCIAVGLAQTGLARLGWMNPTCRLGWRDLIDAFVQGARMSLSVTAAAALVGVIIGVVTLTGVGFKIVYLVTSTAGQWAEAVTPIVPFLTDPAGLTLLFTLLMTALVCVLMGCGIPTTANYLIMIAIAAPILGALGVQPIVAHFFVFYYGVLADITPPVALAAYAAAGIAGADPFKAGNTAFRLGMGKVLVPFVFVFSPSLLIVVDGFTWGEFWLATLGAMAGIYALSAAFAGWLFGPLYAFERALMAVAAILLVAPSPWPTAIGVVLVLPTALRQILGRGQPASG
ncbi:TRAP transporter permease [Jannaschia aquimarina]|uniref:SiaT_4 protein n=1 Tax=Jannaschia aquimarina TaxID=935700 RepID=A0A0D1EQI5_9RHOB|nr:TRAP transporter permease [Jannaschia aquimarina]KIT17870.1 Sialic acid TRAP transporter permease protein SiaT [Jannaschia aquimarina]SNS55950.1 TRAP transporter, 4TM/12TM fusion protein [Jannaschia aquimarina]